MAPLNPTSTVEAVVPKPAPAQRTINDAPGLRSGRPRGLVNYPPCEDYDEELSEIYEKLEIRFTSRMRRIPYKPARRDFYEQTGRNEIDIYGYEYRDPVDDKVKLMIWDYTNGLVRATGIFKCHKPWSKTLPAKVLNKNRGLKDISHKLTGGVIESQGYYMPFECAKAIAKRFCWHVRYALTPIFGHDFPGQCLPPDHPAYGSWEIDQHIIREAAEEARAHRRAALARARPYPSPSPSPDDDDDDDISSNGYPSSSDDDPRPPSTASNGWTLINTPRMQRLTPPPSPPTQNQPSPQSSQVDEETGGWHIVSPTALVESRSHDSDAMNEDSDGTEGEMTDGTNDVERLTSRMSFLYTEKDIEGAHTMMSMRNGGPINENYPGVCPYCDVVVYIQQLRPAIACATGWRAGH